MAAGSRNASRHAPLKNTRMDTSGECLREYILTLGRPRMGVRGPLKPSGRLAEREPEGGKKRELVSRTSVA